MAPFTNKNNTVYQSKYCSLENKCAFLILKTWMVNEPNQPRPLTGPFINDSRPIYIPMNNDP